MRAYNFFVSEPKFTFFHPTVRGCRWSRTFPIFDISICSRDIRDQSLKLSEIVRNFSRVLLYQIFEVRAPKICTQFFYPCLAAHHLDKFDELIFIGPKAISQNALNFGPIFKFSLLKNVWGHLSLLSFTLASLGDSILHVKIWRGRTP